MPCQLTVAHHSFYVQVLNSNPRIIGSEHGCEFVNTIADCHPVAKTTRRENQAVNIDRPCGAASYRRIRGQPWQRIPLRRRRCLCLAERPAHPASRPQTFPVLRLRITSKYAQFLRATRRAWLQLRGLKCRHDCSPVWIDFISPPRTNPPHCSA